MQFPIIQLCLYATLSFAQPGFDNAINYFPFGRQFSSDNVMNTNNGFGNLWNNNLLDSGSQIYSSGEDSENAGTLYTQTNPLNGIQNIDSNFGGINLEGGSGFYERFVFGKNTHPKLSKSKSSSTSESGSHQSKSK